nr:carotenoid-cleaving dioxygenase, mitochondrial-like [Cherax quadricarinatus]
MESFGELFSTTEERVDPVPAKLKGEWPDWLSGSFLRVGPGKYDLGDFTVNHWLDGMAILHKFQIEDGKVSFQSKYLKSDAYKKACLTQRPVFTEFGTQSYPDPCKNIFSRMFSQFEMTDNTSNNIFRIEDQMFVASETCYLRKIDPDNLETKDKVDLSKIMSVNLCSSHPLTDNTGVTYNLGCSFIGGPKYNIVKIHPSKDKSDSNPWANTRTLAAISSSWKASYSYYHSFGMTENYLVFLEQPLLVNTLKLATSQLKGRAFTDCLDWHPQEKVSAKEVMSVPLSLTSVRYLQVCKMDVETGRSWAWRGNEHQYLSEPSFIPLPDAIEEDDGVILCSVADIRKDFPDFLLLVDARTMEEIGRAEVDARVPSSLHGIFLMEKN